MGRIKKGKKVKVTSVKEIGPDDRVAPFLIRFEHADINPNLSPSVDLNQVLATAVYQSEIGGGAGSSSGSGGTIKKEKGEPQPGPSSASRGSSGAAASSGSQGPRRKQVVAIQSDEMTYIGTKGFDNPSALSHTDEKMRTYVALKEGGKLRIFEVQPITVSPYIKGHSHVVEPERDTRIEKTKEEKREEGIDLVKAFGSKKQRLVQDRIEKHTVHLNDMQPSIDAAVDKLEVATAEPVKDESILALIPPCNRSSPTAQDVYNVEDMLANDEMNAMDELAQSFLNSSPSDIKEWRAANRYSDYFFAMLVKLQPRRQYPSVIRTAKIVLYTELLIIFLKLKHESIRKKHIDLPNEFPVWMKKKVIDHFTVVKANGSRARPDEYKDKTCCYIMVLVLLANDLHFDVQVMLTSLNVHIKKLKTLAKAVGITLTFDESTKEHHGMLRLPLPKIKQRQRPEKWRTFRA